MRRQDEIVVPAALRPLLARPADWPEQDAWRVSVAACRASGFVAWAARVEPPTRTEPAAQGERPAGAEVWLRALSPSRPSVVQSEAVLALLAALERIPPGASVEVIAPTSLRYLVEGHDFPVGTPERRLAETAARYRLWARYALGPLEALTNACLLRAYEVLAPLRWPGEAALAEAGSDPPYVLYADGGCAPELCAAAWVLRRGGVTLDERTLALAGPVERDGVRLAEFSAVIDGLRAVPAGAEVAVVTDHADVTDFGVRGVPAFRPSPRVADALDGLREQAAAHRVRWFWAEREETDGQRRCQVLITRHLQAAPARARFLAACRRAGVHRLYLPPFTRWLAPREPLTGVGRARSGEQEQWAATFERTDEYLTASPSGPRLYLRQVRLVMDGHADLAAAFEQSVIATWCTTLARRPSLARSQASYVGQLRSGFALVALLFAPDVALLVQPRPGANLAHALDAASHVGVVEIPASPGETGGSGAGTTGLRG